MTLIKKVFEDIDREGKVLASSFFFPFSAIFPSNLQLERKNPTTPKLDGFSFVSYILYQQLMVPIRANTVLDTTSAGSQVKDKPL